MGSADAAFTSEQVMRLTGITRQRLNYWVKTEILKPDIDQAHGRGRVRLWSFTNLLELKAALGLREELSLQTLRKVIRVLRERGFVAPLAEVRIRVMQFDRQPSRAITLNEQGTWEEPLTGQILLELVVPVEQYRGELHELIEADRKGRRQAGVIERRRGSLGSEAVFAGTRVPVAAVNRMREAGWPEARILEEYPDLTAEDVRAAEQVG
jgi:uncharacterized protein (DUF433 family)